MATGPNDNYSLNEQLIMAGSVSNLVKELNHSIQLANRVGIDVRLDIIDNKVIGDEPLSRPILKCSTYILASRIGRWDRDV